MYRTALNDVVDGDTIRFTGGSKTFAVAMMSLTSRRTHSEGEDRKDEKKDDEGKGGGTNNRDKDDEGERAEDEYDEEEEWNSEDKSQRVSLFAAILVFVEPVRSRSSQNRSHQTPLVWASLRDWGTTKLP